MNILVNKEVSKDILDRLEKLQPTSQTQWGKMTVSQMLAHCSAAMEVATAKKFPPRIFIGRILGGMFKGQYLGEKPFAKNSPTDKSFIIKDTMDFDKEKVRLKTLVKEFIAGGSEKCTTHPHSFFGKLTPDEWGVGTYKHLDHHLRQFGA